MTKIIEFDQNYHIFNDNAAKTHHSFAPIAIVAHEGSRELAQKVNKALFDRRLKVLEHYPQIMQSDPGFLRQDYCVKSKFVRFSSGEGKAVLDGTVRGHDVYFIFDVTNYSIKYKMFNQEIPMSPDDYFQDLKRGILATCGRARRITVVMPYLYESRFDVRRSRESLDCATMIKELFSLGVASIICFEPHEPRVENASPKKSLDIIPATYPLISSFLNNYNDINLSGEQSLMVVAQDESSMKRAMYYASVLEVPLGAFYRQRDYSVLVDGRNPVIDYKYLGESVENRDLIIVDDMFVTGSSFLQTAKMLKERNAKRIFGIACFGMFSKGFAQYDEAYQKKYFDKLFITNLSHIPEEIKNKPWCFVVDMTQDIAQLIDALNYNVSIASLLDHTTSIKKLLINRK